MDLPKRGAEEPSIVELQDGSLLAVIRNSLGAVYKSHSDDGGELGTSRINGISRTGIPPLLKQIPTRVIYCSSGTIRRPRSPPSR